MSLAILFHFLCAQHVSDINEACKTSTTQNKLHQISNTQRTENKTTDLVIQQHSRRLLKMDILMSETCWAHKKWNKIASDIKLVFRSSAITVMHGQINIRCSGSNFPPDILIGHAKYRCVKLIIAGTRSASSPYQCIRRVTCFAQRVVTGCTNVCKCSFSTS